LPAEDDRGGKLYFRSVLVAFGGDRQRYCGVLAVSRRQEDSPGRVMALIRETQPHWQPGALAARSIVGGAATAFGADRHTLACFEIADGVDVLPQWGHVRSVRRTRGMSICRARFCSSRARRSSMVNVMAYPLGIEGATTPPPRRYFRGRAMATSCAGCGGAIAAPTRSSVDRSRRSGRSAGGAHATDTAPCRRGTPQSYAAIDRTPARRAARSPRR
jgi:hypothetical protein